jgi:hypothetical protein
LQSTRILSFGSPQQEINAEEYAFADMIVGAFVSPVFTFITDRLASSMGPRCI